MSHQTVRSLRISVNYDGECQGEIGLRGTLELGVGVTIGIQIEDPRGWGVWDYFD